MWRFGKSQVQENQKPEIQKEEKVKNVKEIVKDDEIDVDQAMQNFFAAMSMFYNFYGIDFNFPVYGYDVLDVPNMITFHAFYYMQDTFRFKNAPIPNWSEWRQYIDEPFSATVHTYRGDDTVNIYTFHPTNSVNTEGFIYGAVDINPSYGESEYVQAKFEKKRGDVGYLYITPGGKVVPVWKINVLIDGEYQEQFRYYGELPKGTDSIKGLRFIPGAYYLSYMDLRKFYSDFANYINGEAQTIACFSNFAERSEWMKGDDSATDHNSSSMISMDCNFDGVMNLLSSIVIKFSSTTDSHPEVWKKFAGEGQPTEENPLYWYTQLKLSNDDVAELDVTENANAWYVYNFFRTLKEQFVNAGPVNPTEFIAPEDMFVYRSFGLKMRYVVTDSGISVKTSRSKGRRSEVSVDNDLKDVLERAGYRVSEVVNFVGYKKPSVSSDATVSSSKDSEIIEYGQMMSLLQEERNAIQDGKIREGYPSGNLWIVGVLQDKRGTYLILYGTESSNASKTETVKMVSETEAGEVVTWEKAYDGEPLDFRSDDYWNNVIFMQNMSNMSITYNDQLWNELIREHEEEGNEMLGYFVVQMTQRN